MKNLKLVLRNIKTYPILRYAVFTYGILCMILIGLNIWQYFCVRSLVEENIMANKNFIETLTIVNDDTKQSYHIATSDIVKSIDEEQKYEYKQFLEKYFEHQSYYLNFWLSMLAIVIGIFAIIVPICFTKFFEDKRRDMENIIRDCKKEKQQTVINLSEMQKKLLQIEDIAKEVKANSMLAEASQNASIGNIDKAISIISNSIAIKKTVANLSLRAHLWSRKKDFMAVINDLEECLKLEKNNIVLANLGWANIGIGRFQKAVEHIKASIEIDAEAAVNYYNLAEAYIRIKDFSKAIDALNDFMVKEREPFIYDDDKINWNRWINESPQNEETESLQLIINNKLKIKKRNEWLPSCEVV